MVAKFEVGKTYVHRNPRMTHTRCVCLALGSRSGFFEAVDGGEEFTLSFATAEYYEEVKPTHTLVRYVNIYRDGVSVTRPTRQQAEDEAGYGRIACKRVEITYTEGEFDE